MADRFINTSVRLCFPSLILTTVFVNPVSTGNSYCSSYKKKINRLGPICWFFVFKSPPFCGLQYSLWLFSFLFPSQFSRWFIIQLLKPKCFTLQCTSLVFLSTTTIVVLISISGNLYSLLTYSSFMYNSWNSIDSLFQNRYHQAELLPTKVHSNMSSCLSSYSISFVYMTV